MAHTVERFIKTSDTFYNTIPEIYDANRGYDSWDVHEQGRLVERWVVREKVQTKNTTGFHAEITYFVEDENDPYS